MSHTYRIQNIRCGGCANTIRRKLGEAGFDVLEVRPEDHAVVVAEAGPERIAAGAAILKALGYPQIDEDSGVGDFARSVVSCAIGRFGPA
jgi:copper chaperone CopZ